METMYATITSKGQVTLPAAARRALGLREGQKVGIRVEGNVLVIDAPHDVQATREVIRQEAIARRTRGRIPVASDGWTARAEDFRAQS